MPSNRRKRVWGRKFPLDKSHFITEMRNGGAAPDPSTQFSLFCLYIFKHPTFHSAQDDEMGRTFTPHLIRKLTYMLVI